MNDTTAPQSNGTPQTYTFPVVIEFDSNRRKTVRQRNRGDDIAAKALKKGERPTRDAIRMANALYIEKLLESGKFKSIRVLARKTGISYDVIYKLLHMLNRSNADIEAQLFEVY